MFLLDAAEIDIRIKSIVTISMYDIRKITSDLYPEKWKDSIKKRKIYIYIKIGIIHQSLIIN